jgi:hypothetical protein
VPTVPRRSGSYVPTAPLPNERVPSGAFQGPPPIDFSPITKAVGRIREEEKQKQDDLAILDADNRLGTLQTDLAVQATQLRGKDSLQALPTVTEQWQKKADEIRSGLSNDDQRLKFEQRASGRFQSLRNSVVEHSANEMKRYDDETTDAALKLATQTALQNYTNPAELERSLADSKTVIEMYGRRNGWSSERIQQKQLEQTSGIHMGVIDQLLQADKDIDATKYFEAHSGELDAKALIQAKDSLDLGSLRGESQRRADSIVASTATLGGGLQEAAKITDPKLREATEGRIRRHWEDVSASDRFDRQQAYEQASAIVAQTGDLYKVPPSLMQRLSASEQIELQHLVNQKRNPERATNWDTYARLLNMAGLNDSTRQEFEQLDLTKYRGQLSDQHYAHLLTLQLGERRQTGGAISSEAKRQAAQAERDATKQRQRAQAAEMLRSLGVDVPVTVPGGPLRGPTRQLRISSKGKQVPQAWIDRASKDENYRRYLEHMGVVFDTAFSSPINPRDTGNITLR